LDIDAGADADADASAGAGAMATLQKDSKGKGRAVDPPEDPTPGVRYSFITYCNTILTHASNALLVQRSRSSTLA